MILVFVVKRSFKSGRFSYWYFKKNYIY